MQIRLITTVSQIESNTYKTTFFYPSTAFLNPTNIFLDLEYIATASNGEALSGDNVYTSTLNSGHSLIESISINLGQCSLTKLDTNYQLVSRVLLQDYTKEARDSFIKDLEGKLLKYNIIYTTYQEKNVQ